jgi:hypothetical protein
MQLHAINKKEPMKKLMGMKRKSAEKESKKHHPEGDFRRGRQEAFLLGLS